MFIGVRPRASDFLIFIFYKFSYASHHGPDDGEHECFGEKDAAATVDAELVLYADGVGLEAWLAAAEGVHQQFVKTGLEEAVELLALYVEVAGKAE